MIKLISPRTATLVVILSVFHVIAAQGQSRNEFLETTTKPDPSLAEVDSIFVDVHATNLHYLLGISVEESIALTEKIQREVEVELRKSRIKVAPERWTIRGHPHLVVSVLLADPFEGNTEIFPFTTFVGFRQKVILQRQPGVSVLAFTWQRVAIGYATRENIFASIIETTLAKVNEFNITLRKSK